MNASLTQVTRLMTRRTRSGQSLIIIAFAFIALIAFVGIATDVAMLFVRFSALRRAVDAAAIGSAGQIRSNADYYTMTAIAEQFIKLHGIDPTLVKVETCETEISDVLKVRGFPPTVPSLNDINTARNDLIAGTGTGVTSKSELCTPTAQKLVRVSAQLDSPTSFLSLIGWKTVKLSTSSISQTAQLDVALLLDTSLSEANDTIQAERDNYGGAGPYYEMGSPSINNPQNYTRLTYDTDHDDRVSNNPTNDSSAAGHPSTSTCYGDPSVETPFNGTIPGPNLAVPYMSICNNADALRYFRDFTNSSPIDTNKAIQIANGSGCGSYASCSGQLRPPDQRWGVNLDPAPVSYISQQRSSTNDSNGNYNIRYECWYDPQKSPDTTRANYAWAGCCNDPTIQSDAADGSTTFSPLAPVNPQTGAKTWYTGLNETNWYVYDDATLPESIINDQREADSGAGSHAQLTYYDPDGTAHTIEVAKLVAGGRNWSTVGTQATTAGTPGMHQYGNPDQYRYVRGKPGTPNCNAPANSTVVGCYYDAAALTASHSAYAGAGVKYPFNRGDGNFSDLLCQPFKQVRDAARRFINRMDFVRGDRLILVTFNSTYQDIYPYNSQIPVITDKTTAIETLNMQVGVEVNPSHLQSPCQTQPVLQDIGPSDNGDWMGQKFDDQTYYIDANPKGVADYWTQAQCPDTNTGGGILQGTLDLINSNWIRRDSVWVMVVLSDGYPNRTPGLGDQIIIGGKNNAATRPENLVIPASADPNGTGARPNPNADDGSQTDIRAVCDKFNSDQPLPPNDIPQGPTNPNNPNFGDKPEFCSVKMPGAGYTPVIGNAAPTGSGIVPFYESNGWGPRDNNPFDPPGINWQRDSNPGHLSGSAYTANLLYNSGNADAYFSFGFCPYWTFCTANGTNKYPDGTVCTAQTNNDTTDLDGNKWPWATSAQYKEQNFPTCSDSDPYSRHFCMDPKGNINGPGALAPAGAAYQCDPNYDAMDFAMDMTDFAALQQYTSQAKGNFIAMYSILFSHAGGGKDNQYLGTQMGHYISDAGDNGVIDNAIQVWYRDQRDISVNPPPIGGNLNATGIVGGAGKQARNRLGAAATADLPITSARNAAIAAGVSPIAVSPYWGTLGMANFISPFADPCAKEDYTSTSNCGQFFFASDINSVNSAFTEIARRLFTRLSG